jgi:hypothetical protein
VRSYVEPPVYHPVNVASDHRNTYLMVVRPAVGITKHVDRLRLYTAASPPLSTIPSYVRRALVDPHWCCAMEEEYETLLSNNTLIDF